MKNSIKVEWARFVSFRALAFKIARVLQCKADDIFELEEVDWL